ncbi:MAG: hypothetical protein B6242_07890 [Anaerolineaceae bacterium 4572_78]|nr:MAG: hypothetical protein B6242_07890 [Anaerolineaceae bacterium 4572_78]
MAKNAEDRYQSAYGLKYDLEQCLTMLTTPQPLPYLWEGHKTPILLQGDEQGVGFKLATHDFSGKFHIPQKLYGRNIELQTLMQTFERVSTLPHVVEEQEWGEFLLISGYSGVGKTALVHEIHKPITAKHGHFIAGKFDQFHRNIPYYAFSEMFNAFCQYILTESDKQLARWKKIILKAVGNTGQVLIDIIPNLQLIIGQQPSVPQLGAKETEYRENEVSDSHPLMQTVAALHKQESKVTILHLENLSHDDVGKLIADTLNVTTDAVSCLTGLVYEKTHGNPFFVSEFMKSLYHEELLAFDFSTQTWLWDVDKIRSKDLASNVVDLIANKIQTLPTQSRQLLQLAACIGSTFDLETLSVINKNTISDTFSMLWQTITEGLIVPLDERYRLMENFDEEQEQCTALCQARFKFQHNRIQQAAYTLIPHDKKTSVHLEIGRLLLANVPDSDMPEHVFDIVNQLNKGKKLIDDHDEKMTLAKLNLQAGKRAKNGTAYQPAFEYLETGINLLDDNSRQTEYQLIYQLYKEIGETVFLAGDSANSDMYLNIALEHANSKFDEARVYTIKIIQFAAQGKFKDAVGIGTTALRMLGMNVPDADDPVAIKKLTQIEMALYQKNMQKYSVEDLYHLPLMQDETMKICTETIAIMSDSIAILFPHLLGFYITNLVNTTIKYGLSRVSPVGFVFNSIVQASVFHDLSSAYRFIALALKTHEERLRYRNIAAKIYYLYGNYAILKKHIKVSIDYFKKAYQTGFEVGDIVYTNYALSGLSRFIIPLDLAKGITNIKKAIAFYQKDNYITAILSISMIMGFCYCLQGKTTGKTCFDYDSFSEKTYIDEMKSSAPTVFAIYTQYKFQICIIFQDYQQALPFVHERKKWIAIRGGVDLLFRCDYYLLTGITVSALYPMATDAERDEYRQILDECLAEYKFLAEQCPANFEHGYSILQAQKAQLENRLWQASEFYDSAIESAQRHGFRFQEAIACELAAKFYLSHGRNEIGQLYLGKARYAYSLWGATGKVHDLEEKYPNLLAWKAWADNGRQSSSTTIISPTTTFTTSTISSSRTRVNSGLDLASLMKSAHALSQEIMLDELIVTLMEIAIENVGAERGCILLHENEKWFVAAYITTKGHEILLDSIPLSEATKTESAMLSAAVVNYVIHSHKHVILHNAISDEQFRHDAYIIAHKPKSVLCVPLINRGKLTGMLYLENNLTIGAFTQDRFQVLNLLSTQAAIATENARLYTDLQASEKKYRTIFEESRDIIFISTVDGQFLDVSPTCFTLLGYTSEELLEMNAVEIYANPDTRLQFQKEMTEKHSIRDFEFQAKRKDEKVIEVAITATLRHNADGTILGYQGLIRDITSQKQAEHERLKLTGLKRELDVAHEMQISLLHPPKPNWHDLDVICYTAPAREVGGDFYAYSRSQNKKVLFSKYILAIGDVSGKGVSAALIMATSLSRLEASLSANLSPEERLIYLDKALTPYTKPRHQNCALCYVEIIGVNTQHPFAKIVNAGCIPPYIKRTDGSVEWPDVGGFALGQEIGSQFGYNEVRVKLKKGDMVILTSDGVAEANNANRDLFGFDRLEDIIKNAPITDAQGMLDFILAEINVFVGSAEPHDDLTIVIAQV